jgi:hypothetical protein
VHVNRREREYTHITNFADKKPEEIPLEISRRVGRVMLSGCHGKDYEKVRRIEVLSNLRPSFVSDIKIS